MKKRSFEEIAEALNPEKNTALQESAKSSISSILTPIFFCASAGNLLGHLLYQDIIGFDKNTKFLFDMDLGGQILATSGPLMILAIAFGIADHKHSAKVSDKFLQDTSRYLDGLDFRHKNKSKIEIVKGDKPPSLEK